MVESEKIYAYPRTRDFLLAAIAEGAHLNPILRRNATEDTWIRQRNMIGAYFASDATHQSLADIYGVARQRIFQIIRHGVVNLWRSSSPELKQLYPFESIPLNKPESLADHLARSSRSVNSLMVKVLAGLEAGKSLAQIKQKEDLTGDQIADVRIRTRKLGIEIPYQAKMRSPAERKRLVGRLSQATDKTLVRTLFREVRLPFCRNHSRGEDRCFVTVTNLAREAGYYFRNTEANQFVRPLQKADIPIRSFRRRLKRGKNKGLIQRYYFITRPFEEQSKQIYQHTKKLDKFKQNPVTQIAGPKTDRLPTTTDFVREKDYRTVGKLFRQTGLQIPRVHNSFEDTDFFNPNCPVPLFRVGGKSRRSHYACYPVDQEEVLRKWILDRVNGPRT